MKLMTYERNGSISCGFLSDEGLIDIPSFWPGPNPPRSVKEILVRGEESLEEIDKISKSKDTVATPRDKVKVLAPIPRPGKLLALAGNYTEHIEEASLKKGFKLGLTASSKQETVPRPFLKPATTVTGPGDTIPWPAYSEQVDYEIELAVVIGKATRCVKPEEAMEYVGGFTILNDVSARSVTFSQGRKARPWDEFYDWLNGKWADGFCPMGPWLLTTDEVKEVQNLEMELSVNGRVRQKANTSQMIFPVADVVSFLSYIMTLEAGDVIATGTPGGVAAVSGNFLKEGDLIECRIEKLGTLRNPLGAQPQQFYKPLG